MSEPVLTGSRIDALPPPKVARKAEVVGIAKAAMHPLDVFVLAVTGNFVGAVGTVALAGSCGSGRVPEG